MGRRPPLLPVLLLLALPCALPAQHAAREMGQDTARAPAAYGTLTAAVSAARAVDAGEIGAYWDLGTGFRVDLAVPFHLGEAAGWLLTMPHDARSPGQPDYRAYLLGLDWRFGRSLHPRLRPSVGVGAGNYLARFADVTTKGLARESEIFVSASGGLDVRVTGGTALTGRVTGVHVFTSTAIRAAYAHIGVAHTMTTPAWLRGVIE